MLLVMSLMAFFVLSSFPQNVLDEVWDLIESVSEGFPTYSSMFLNLTAMQRADSTITSKILLPEVSSLPANWCQGVVAEQNLCRHPEEPRKCIKISKFCRCLCGLYEIRTIDFGILTDQLYIVHSVILSKMAVKFG